MKLVQRGGSVPESKQEVIGFDRYDVSHKIQEFIDKYAVRVIAIWDGGSTENPTVWVLFEEEQVG